MAAEVKMDLRLNGLASGGKNDNMTSGGGTEAHSSNGNHVNGTGDRHHDNHHEDEEGEEEVDDLGQISPSSRRRSTRASAIKAAEKIKYKEELLPEGSNANDDIIEEESRPEPPAPPSKKRKLEDGSALNQFSHRFGIKLYEGEVYMLSDDSEISSLNEQEVEVMRKNYEKEKAREPTQEQMDERLLMLRKAEAELRLEEAKLAMLRRIAKSVTDPNKNQSAQKEKAKCQDKAYQPVSAKPNAAPQNLSHKAKNATNQNQKSLLAFANLTPQQTQDLLQRALQMDKQQLTQLAAGLSKGGSNPAATQFAQALQAALLKQQASASGSSSQTNANMPPSSSASSSAMASMPTSSSASNLAAMNPLTAQTPAQRAAAARQAFRRQADQQLAQLATPPKAPAHNVYFIPNASQPDFCFLLGLDLVVQRVLKDKQVDMAIPSGPYECEECSTDFTPSWRAIGPNENDLHLYCEACVHNAQKKKIRQDHTANMKKIFSKFAAQEKDFEKQIADGKLEAALAEAAKAQAAQQAAQAAASRPNQTSTPQPVKANTTPSVAQGSSKVSAPGNLQNTPSSSSGRGRGSQQNNNQMNSAQMQQQLLQMAQMARSNPMIAAMMQPMLTQAMANPTMLSQMMQMQWNPMMLAAAQAAAAQQARLAAAQGTNNMAAMSMLAQAVQNAAAGSSSSSASQTPQQAAMAALSALANPTSASSAASPLAAQLAAAGLTPAALMGMNPAMMQKLAQFGAANNKKK